MFSTKQEVQLTIHTKPAGLQEDYTLARIQGYSDGLHHRSRTLLLYNTPADVSIATCRLLHVSFSLGLVIPRYAFLPIVCHPGELRRAHCKCAIFTDFVLSLTKCQQLKSR